MQTFPVNVQGIFGKQLESNDEHDRGTHSMAHRDESLIYSPSVGVSGC